jgi:hypothetical protein
VNLTEHLGGFGHWVRIYEPVGEIKFVGIYAVPEFPDDRWKERQTFKWPAQTIINDPSD